MALETVFHPFSAWLFIHNEGIEKKKAKWDWNKDVKMSCLCFQLNRSELSINCTLFAVSYFHPTSGQTFSNVKNVQYLLVSRGD
ncbi:hypothetical protein T4B_4483 [Trichinella pseudospiralis]|uniref:Uncharacterized protein n=1 Tax=Trichinella pseudospiralis TaxID=6337 RepID=A0A0V1J1S0_TRIPS|nr:hypothetical protein T4B_4483 [Trichinella pseudospiralis]